MAAEAEPHRHLLVRLPARQATIKTRFHLAVTQDEKDEMIRGLSSGLCDGSRLKPLPPSEFKAPAAKPIGEPKPSPKPEPQPQSEATPKPDSEPKEDPEPHYQPGIATMDRVLVRRPSQPQFWVAGSISSRITTPLQFRSRSDPAATAAMSAVAIIGTFASGTTESATTPWWRIVSSAA